MSQDEGTLTLAGAVLEELDDSSGFGRDSCESPDIGHSVTDGVLADVKVESTGDLAVETVEHVMEKDGGGQRTIRTDRLVVGMGRVPLGTRSQSARRAD